MDPETMTAKAVATHLGVDIRDVKQLERDGKIVAHQRGRGLWSTKYLADSVRAYHDAATLEKFAVEAECPVAGASTCCGDPESCKNSEGCGSPDTCSYDDHSEPEPEGSRIQFGGGSFWLGPAIDVDPEIEAMDAIRAALETLDNEQRIRAVEWAIARFEIRKGASA